MVPLTPMRVPAIEKFGKQLLKIVKVEN